MGGLPVSTWSESALSVFGASGIKEAAHVRRIIRQGGWTSHTSGLASEHVQGNVVILPADEANDFLRYCQRNPKPCPVLAVSEPGQAGLPALGADIDICTDLPRYRVWRHGEVVDEPHDIVNLWRADLVTFQEKLPTNAASKFKSTPNKTGHKPAWLLASRQNRAAFTGHYWNVFNQKNYLPYTGDRPFL